MPTCVDSRQPAFPRANRESAPWDVTITILFLATLLILIGNRSWAQNGEPGDYFIEVTAGSEKGLPSSSVTAIAQTPDGYLWVGTYDGLARFDGGRFVKFDPDNSPGLQNARIRRLATTPDGTLWISAYDGSLTSFRDGRFTLEWPGEGVPDSTTFLISPRGEHPRFMTRSGDILTRSESNASNRWTVLRPPGASPGQLVAEAGDGAIWLCGRDQRITLLRSNRFEVLPNNGSLTGSEVHALTADPYGGIWVATEREVAVWTGDRFLNMSPTNGEQTLDCSFLRVLPDGSWWSIANNRLRQAHGREWILEPEATKGLFNGSRERTGMHQDAQGGIWLYDYGKGLFHFRSDGTVRELAKDENFPGERVDCFLEDREGNVWVGVDRGGLVRIRQKRFNVLMPPDVANKAAVSVCQDYGGGVWVGTYGGGLHRWSGSGWVSFTLPGGVWQGFVFSVISEPGGRIWTSAGDEDLYFADAGRFTPFTPAVHGVKALLRGSDGRIWVGTKGGLGVITKGQFRQYYPNDGMARTVIRALAEDNAGNIWAGAGDGVLSRIGGAGITNFQATDNLGRQPIWSLWPDTNGVIWAGTFRGGLLRFDQGRFTRFTSKEGLPDDIVSQILDDGKGRLWMGSKEGIFHAAKSELEAFARGELGTINCNAYGRSDGLPSLECSDSYQPACWRTTDGRLLFTTLRGVVAVRPDRVEANTLPPPVLIENVYVDGVETDFESASDAAAGSSRFKTVVVPPGKQQIRILYTGLSFVSPDRVRFKYKLDRDHEWTDAGTARAVQYSLLPPGHYRFEVRACNNDGVWNESGAALLIHVKPHLVETVGFKLAATAVGLGVVIISVRRIYSRRYRRRLELLERQRAIEQDRARIAKDIHDDLGAGLTHIALLSELARRDSAAELPNHVSQISDMARELTRNMDEIVWAVDPQNDTLDSLVSYISKFAQEYLSVANIRCRLDVPAELPPHVLPAEVRHNLFLALKEGLNNIVKHAEATEATLRLVVEASAFALVLTDNGRGAAIVPGQPASRLDRISSGHGLANMEKRLRASGGSFRIRSLAGGGTELQFRIELDAKRSPEVVTGRAGKVNGA